MADITVRRVGELQRGVFKILLNSPEGFPAKHVLQRLEQVVPPTEFEKSDYPKHPGIRRFEKMARFATIGPVKAGWLVKSKGRWYISEEGRKAYNQITDPEEFNREARRLYLKWRTTQPEAITELEAKGAEGTTSSEAAELTAEEAAALDFLQAEASTFEEAEETAWEEIEQFVQAMNPYDLQKLVAALLRAMGYHVSWIAPPGPDKGIDILAHNDPLGTSTPRIKVQVKRRADRIRVEGIRSFMAILGEQDVGIFVSTGGFTSDAESEARTKETRKLTLVDLEKLVELWVQHYDKVADSDKLLLPLKPVYYLVLPE
jgi:restriction system protein